MAERTKPGQIRVHRGFLKADGLRALWPEGVRVREIGEDVVRKFPFATR